MSATHSAGQKRDNFVKLNEYDRERMARLYEEVKGRLLEMSLIMARNLNMSVSERTTVMLRPIGIEPGVQADSVQQARGIVEVHCTQTPDGVWECGCYDYDEGTCGPCPWKSDPE